MVMTLIQILNAYLSNVTKLVYAITAIILCYLMYVTLMSTQWPKYSNLTYHRDLLVYMPKMRSTRQRIQKLSSRYTDR